MLSYRLRYDQYLSLWVNWLFKQTSHMLNICQIRCCILFKLKICSKKECCKQCRHVKFKGTMTKWPVRRKTHRTTQNAQNTKTQHNNKAIFTQATQKAMKKLKCLILCTNVCLYLLFRMHIVCMRFCRKLDCVRSFCHGAFNLDYVTLVYNIYH